MSVMSRRFSGMTVFEELRTFVETIDDTAAKHDAGHVRISIVVVQDRITVSHGRGDISSDEAKSLYACLTTQYRKYVAHA